MRWLSRAQDHASMLWRELPDAVLVEITELGSFDFTLSSASPMIKFRSR